MEVSGLTFGLWMTVSDLMSGFWVTVSGLMSGISVTMSGLMSGSWALGDCVKFNVRSLGDNVGFNIKASSSVWTLSFLIPLSRTSSSSSSRPFFYNNPCSSSCSDDGGWSIEAQARVLQQRWVLPSPWTMLGLWLARSSRLLRRCMVVRSMARSESIGTRGILAELEET